MLNNYADQESFVLSGEQNDDYIYTFKYIDNNINKNIRINMVNNTEQSINIELRNGSTVIDTVGVYPKQTLSLNYYKKASDLALDNVLVQRYNTGEHEKFQFMANANAQIIFNPSIIPAPVPVEPFIIKPSGMTFVYNGTGDINYSAFTNMNINCVYNAPNNHLSSGIINIDNISSLSLNENYRINFTLGVDATFRNSTGQIYSIYTYVPTINVDTSIVTNSTNPISVVDLISGTIVPTQTLVQTILSPTNNNIPISQTFNTTIYNMINNNIKSFYLYIILTNGNTSAQYLNIVTKSTFVISVI